MKNELEQKKEYQSPSMRIIELKHQNCLMEISNPGSDPSEFLEGPLG